MGYGELSVRLQLYTLSFVLGTHQTHALMSYVEALRVDRITFIFMNYSKTWSNLGRKLYKRKTGISPHPSNLLLTILRRCFCCGLFELSLFVRCLSVFDYLFIFRIALWPSAGKELPSWLSACAVSLCAVLIICVPFPCCLGQNVKLDSFGSWSLCFNLLQQSL